MSVVTNTKHYYYFGVSTPIIIIIIFVLAQPENMFGIKFGAKYISRLFDLFYRENNRITTSFLSAVIYPATNFILSIVLRNEHKLKCTQKDLQRIAGKFCQHLAI